MESSSNLVPRICSTLSYFEIQVSVSLHYLEMTAKVLPEKSEQCYTVLHSVTQFYTVLQTLHSVTNFAWCYTTLHSVVLQSVMCTSISHICCNLAHIL